MKLDKHYICEPRYFEMLISATGILSNTDRIDRIKSIAQHNIWLAARCKNTCVNEESDIVDFLIRRCFLLYERFEDIQAIIALFELREYGILSDIFGLSTKTRWLPMDIRMLWNANDQSLSHAFTVFAELLPLDIVIRLFNRFLELGYMLDSHCYNAVLSRLKSTEEIDHIMTQMVSSGVEADAETYYHLARKSSSWESANMYYKSFLSVCNSQTAEHLIVDMHIKMLYKCKELQQVYYIYNQFNSFPISNKTKVEMVYFEKVIELSPSRSEYTTYYQKSLMQFINEKDLINKNRKYKKELVSGILHVGIAYLNREALEHMEIEETIRCFNEVITQLQEMGIKKIKVFTRPMCLVIKEQDGYAKGKHFLESMQVHYKELDALCYYELLKKSLSLDEVKYALQGIGLSDNQKCPPKLMEMFNSIDITLLLAKCDEKMAEYLYEVLSKNDYLMNLIIYNAFLKQLSLKKSLEVMDSMLLKGIHPDIQSIQPLLRKWNMINELIQILKIASINNIEPDGRSTMAIIRQTERYDLQVPLIDMYIDNKDTMSLQIGKSWMNALSKVCYSLIKPQTSTVTI